MYGTFALGTVIAARLGGRRGTPAQKIDAPNLFATVLGASAVLSGLLMLVAGDQFLAPSYDTVRPHL